MLARQYSRPQQKGASLPNRVFQLKPPYEGFHEYYDEVQDYLEKIAGMDEMISGIQIYISLITINPNLHVYI